MRSVLLLLSLAQLASSFMLPATRLAFNRGTAASIARPGAAGRRMMSRTLAMAANPKVRGWLASRLFKFVYMKLVGGGRLADGLGPKDTAWACLQLVVGTH